MSNNEELAYKYAWDWFQHHAKQRYSSFYYFLLIMGALAYGYIQTNSSVQYKVVIGIMGLVISFAFLMIEKRNNMLVNDGRAALEYIEKKYKPFKNINIRAIEKQREKCFLCKFITHIVWFRIVILALMIMSILAILYPINFNVHCFWWFVLAVILLAAITLTFKNFEKKYDLPIKAN